MNTPEPNGGFDLLLCRNFLDAQTCERLRAEMRAARGGAATVYASGASGNVDERVRRATRAEPARETAEFVRALLAERRRDFEEHFAVRLGGCEEPQFLRYGVGDFFVAHQDGNTGLIRSEREQTRAVSVVIFLSDESEEAGRGDHSGGSLVFHDYGVRTGGGPRRFSPRGEAGTLVAFRPETTHEVTPVTRGERLSVACWFWRNDAGS